MAPPYVPNDYASTNFSFHDSYDASVQVLAKHNDEVARTELPSPLSGPLVWEDGAGNVDLATSTLQLEAQDIAELEEALRTFKGKLYFPAYVSFSRSSDSVSDYQLDGDKVCPANFPLPNLRSRLKIGTNNIHEGQGWLLVRGLDLSKYSVADGVTLYLGISSYIADLRGMQDKKGTMLCE